MTILNGFLFAPRKWSWGGIDGDDCTTFCASWLQLATGVDLADDLRGTYADQAGARAILDRAHGLESFLAGRLEPNGFLRTSTPQDGDIGLIKGDHPDGPELVPAIRFGPLWALMTAYGVKARHLEWTGVAWRILP